jgi:diguanylate cyclase (GGDEF)-like protein
LLIEICRRLALCLRQTDTLARVGGDEFVLLLTDLSPSDDGQWQEVVRRVLQSVAQPVADGAHSLAVSCSLGVALFPDEDLGPQALMRHADQAMYQAKQAGKNRYARHQPTPSY